jgi:hypothetical protein
MITDAVQIKINNVNIFPSRSTKFVGFEVDTKLYWRTHVEKKRSCNSKSNSQSEIMSETDVGTEY